MKKPRLFFILLFAALAGPVLGGMTSQMKAFTLAPVGIVTTITQVTPPILLLPPFDRFILHKKVSLASLGGTFLSIAGGVAILFLAA